MKRRLISSVRKRAGERCEYCLLPQSAREYRFPVDHVIARQHGGLTTVANLAMCCSRCNLHKGPNIAGIDPSSGQLVRLFNPRTDLWSQHFRWQHTTVIGITPIGGVTVLVLDMNHRLDVAIRGELIELGLFPPH